MSNAAPAIQHGPRLDQPLGLIGLGLLGAALAERALAAGISVLGFDLDASHREILNRQGGRGLASARDVAQACRRILLVLPHDGVTREVLRDIESVLAPGTMILDVTTGDPRSAESLALSLAERGVVYLDATISRSSAQARRGRPCSPSPARGRRKPRMSRGGRHP